MKLNKTCCDLVNFGSCFIVHSLGVGLFLFIDRPTRVKKASFRVKTNEIFSLKCRDSVISDHLYIYAY